MCAKSSLNMEYVDICKKIFTKSSIVRVKYLPLRCLVSRPTKRNHKQNEHQQ